MPGYSTSPQQPQKLFIRGTVSASKMDGWTRLLIVGGVAAVVGFLAWPYTLHVVFESNGEPPMMAEATDGEQAMRKAVKLLLLQRKLRAGDKLTVTPAE